MSNVQEDAVLGRIALHYKLVSEEQLGQASQRLAAAPGKKIGEVMLELRFISADQLKWLHNAQEQYLAKQRGPQTPGSAAALSAPVAALVAAAPAPAPSAPPPSAPGNRQKLPTLEQILTKAREAAALEHTRMLGELKREVGRLVIGTTAKVTGKVLNADDQKRLSEEAAREVAA